MNKIVALVLFMFSVNCQAQWQLESQHSVLSFMTTKNADTMEVHEFDRFSGEIDEQGMATLTIELASVNTGIAKRDQRMSEFLFKTSTYAQANISVALDDKMLNQLAVGKTTEVEIEAKLQLHGETQTILTPVSITKTAKNKLLVVNLLPIIVDGEDYELVAGIAKLRELAGLKRISAKVPVNFVLTFTQ